MHKTVLFILSTNYAGSHLLSLQLGSHSQAQHVGEVKGLRKAAHKRSKSFCAVCGNEKRCPLYRGITPENINNTYDILFKNSPPETRLLVDISKKPSWAGRFPDISDCRIKYIHLIRDPRALVRRWTINNPQIRPTKRIKLCCRYPNAARRLLPGPAWFCYLYKWLQQNRLISDFISCNRLDHQLITYFQLATRPGETISSITRWLGMQYEPGQLHYWNFEHHGTQKKEYEWVKQQQAAHFDTRWRNDISDAQQQTILTEPAICNYLETLGLDFCENGLTVRA